MIMRLPFLVLFILLSSSAFSFEDGIVSPEGSTGSFDINLRIPEIIKFSVTIGLDQKTLSDGDVVKYTDTCISYNSGSRYNIAVTTDSGDFTLNRLNKKNKNTEKQVYFNAYWNDSSGIEGRKKLEYGKPLSGQTIDAQQTADCLSGKLRGNSNFSIQVSKEKAPDVIDGKYGTAISIIISPE